MNVLNTEALWPEQWLQLAVMIDAGLDIEKALKTLKGRNKQLDKELSVAIGYVQRGNSLASALKKAKVISKSDYTSVNIAEKAGKLELGLNFIAKRRLKWNQRIKTLLGALWLPKCLLLIGACAAIFIRIASAGQTMGESVASVAIVLLWAWALITLSVWLIQRDLLIWLSIGWRLPWLRRKSVVYKLNFEQVFYRLVTWQIAAGVAPDETLHNAQQLLTASAFKRNVKSAASAVAKGQALPECLAQHQLILTQALNRVLKTSNQAGMWEQGVLHHLNLQQQTLALKADDFFKWLPRAYYVFALVVITKYMFV